MNVAATKENVEHNTVVAGWFSQFHASLFRYLVRLTADEQVAADVLQDTFLQALHVVRHNDVPQYPFAWLHRVASNLAYNTLKRRARFSRLRLHVSGTTTGFEQDVATAQLVRQCLGKMRRPEIEALLLYEWVGLSCADIAALTGEQPVAIRMRLSRARARFTALYQPEGNE